MDFPFTVAPLCGPLDWLNLGIQRAHLQHSLQVFEAHQLGFVEQGHDAYFDYVRECLRGLIQQCNEALGRPADAIPN